MNRAYYQNSIRDFIEDDESYILDQLTEHHHFNLDQSQRYAWKAQVHDLKEELRNLPKGNVYFEFSIPRMGKRVDVVIVIDNLVFIVEYKVGSKVFNKYDMDQALDYALDLKNFHEGSHKKLLIPVLVATSAESVNFSWGDISWSDDGISNVLLASFSELNELINKVINSYRKQDVSLSNKEWHEYGYKPTPTIIEAAQALYQGHNVEEISRSDSGAQNLSKTAQCITEVIESSKLNNRKSICFITGVPGAGKTLAGLNISTQTFDTSSKEEHAVFLSGNGPLVFVLREALARDEKERTGISKSEASTKINKFIQNIHHFRDDGLRSDDAPDEHVVIFDEAQRAWNLEKASDFMTRKKGVKDFSMSEPEFLIDYMNRREDWGVIICLVGVGQEINTGEAGINEWFRAIYNRFPNWDAYYSPELKQTKYGLKDYYFDPGYLNLFEKSELHLSVSIRSFRAEKLSDFIEEVINGNNLKAKSIFEEIPNFEFVITRDLNKAKKWLKGNARGTERYGLVASSKAVRLKANGIFVKNEIKAENWFLNDKYDTRSSYYLEDVASEFDIQGLELDWVGICWDANLRRVNNEWNHFKFIGSKWQSVKSVENKEYLSNSYRVLLTRARQGNVIYIPYGDSEDETRPPEYYDETFNYLLSCGLKEIK